MMNSFRKGSDASSGFFSESFSSQNGLKTPPPLGSNHHPDFMTLERQNSFDSLDYYSHDEEEEARTAPPTNKKGKKKKHFSMFRRSIKRKSKSKKKNDEQFSVSAGLMQTLSVPPQGVRQSFSNASLSYESEASIEHTESDQELVDTLMNPTPSPSPLGTELLQATEQQLAESSADEGTTQHLYLVQVTLHSGHNLAIRDRTGSSDPYVKFKCHSFKYRSSVVYRNLNPEWNETFSFKITDPSHTPLTLKVYDYDFGSLDDFMGGASVDLSPYMDGVVQIVDVGLEDPAAAVRGETLGFIRIFLQITEDEMVEAEMTAPNSKTATWKSTQKLRSQQSNQLWRSVLGVTLLEGKSLLPMDDNGLSDPYCKFKLGSQKYKSKTRPKSLNPQWKERFSLRMYDGDSTILHMEVWDHDFPQSDDFIGSCEVDLSSISPEVTHNLTLSLKGTNGGDAGSIHVLLVITGTSVEEEDGEGEVQASLRREVNMKEAEKKYSLLQTANLKAIKDVGFLRVKIERAEALPGWDTFAVVEVGNSVVRTQTVGRSTSPIWDKTFYFNVTDIHNDLEVSVCNEVKNKSGKSELIGKIRVPLLRIESGVPKMYVLKDKHCLQSAKSGVVSLECELIYNPVRACIRTINPRESKLLEEEQKFKRKVLVNNIKRVVNLLRTLRDAWEFIQSLWSWENKAKSTAAFIIFLIVCLFGELWMFFVVGAFVFLNQYLLVYIRGKHDWQISQKRALSIHSVDHEDTNEDSLSNLSDFTDLEEEVQSKEARTNLREKLRQFQEVLVFVQNILGFLADLGERVKNLFNWSVPFLCWMAVCILLLASILFYVVPLRYVILAWGINKFTKRLRKPNYIENNELLDFLSRSPCDRQLLEWHEAHLRPTLTAKKFNKKSKRRKSKY